MKKFFRHCYYAIRYGDWDIGWDKDWLTSPDHEWFYCGHIYYDGNHAAIRVGKFFVGGLVIDEYDKDGMCVQ